MDNKFKIAFFTPFIRGSRGNSTTAKRIVSGIKAAGLQAVVFAYEEEQLTEEKRSELERCSVFHILHITRFLKWKEKHQFNLTKPYIITNGGTDVNHDLLDESAARPYLRFMKEASAISVFTEDARRRIGQLVQHPNIVAIPQSIWFPDAETDFSPHLPAGFPRILLPAGLRKVKDVFFLMDDLYRLKMKYRDLQFVIAGIVIEPDVTEQLANYQKKYSWLTFCGDVPLEGMKSLYSWADIVLNTSVSEGQPTSILEAMSAGCMVFARKNPGNESVVVDGKNGFLFSTGEQFFKQASVILENPSMQEKVRKRAKAYVERHHSHNEEIEHYIALYDKAAGRER